MMRLVKAPNAAGLKTWKFLSLIKFLENMAASEAVTNTYKGALGEMRMASIRPVANAAESLKSLIFLSFRKKASKRRQEITPAKRFVIT